MGTVVLKNCSSGGTNRTPEVFKDVINNTSSFSITANDLKGVKTLSNAFVHSNLSSFEMPKNITSSLDSTTLTGCKNLTAYTVEGGSTKYRVVDGCLFGYDSYGNPSTSLYRGTASGVVPPSDFSGRIVSIGAGAFNDFTNLTSVIFEDDVIVDTNAYSGCSNIKYVYGDSQDIANVLENSGSTSFDVTITGKTTGIIRNLFYNNSYVKSLTVATDSPIYVGSNAFRYTNLDKVIIPAISGLESNAFANCSNLKEVSISHYEPLQNYGTYLYSAFGSCPIEKLTCPTALLSYIPLTAVKEVELTEGTFINTNTFSNNSNIQKITIPNTIKNMYNWCFYECPNLTDVNFEGTISEWCSINFNKDNTNYRATNPLCPGTSGSVSSPKGNLYLYGKRVTEIVFPPNANISDYSLRNAKINSVRFLGSASVGTEAFEYSSLSDVYFASTLPGGLSSNVFNGCSNLRNIHYASTLSDLVPQTVSDDGFFMTLTATTAMKTLYINENQRVTDLVIPEGLTNPGRFPYLDIVSVSIPSTVTSLGNAVFRNCSNLETVTFANNSAVTSISTSDYSPFYYCSSIKSMTLPFVGGSKTPNSASSSTVFGAIFGTLSFTGATAVTQNYSQSRSRTCYIPNGLTHVTILGGRIMYGAFSGCTMITNLNIGEDVSMLMNAFTGVNGLANLVISPNNRSIRYNTFTGAVITNAEMPAELYYLASREATITNLTMNGGNYIYPRMFENDTTLTSITLPNTIKMIGMDAFKGCSNLTQLDIPDSVVYLPQRIADNSTILNFSTSTWFNLVQHRGFASITNNNIYLDDESISELNIPEGITTLMPYSADINSLRINISNTVTLIGSHSIAVRSPASYPDDTLYIPSSVKRIDDYGITVNNLSSSGLNKISLSEGLEELGYNSIVFVFGVDDGFEIPSTVKSVSPCFCGSNVIRRYFSLNSNNTYFTMVSGCLIENSTHKLINACTQQRLSNNYVGVSLPQNQNISEICEYAFFNSQFYDTSYNPTNLIIPDSVTSIDDSAFRSSSGLLSVTISASTQSIGDYAFANCDMSSVTFDVNSSLTSLQDYVFYGCSSLTSITIPDSVTSIGEWAFRGCTGLTSVILPTNLLEIRSDAFLSCTSLTSIVLPDTLEQIGTDAFRGCTNLQYNVYDNANYLGTSTNPYFALISATSNTITSCVIHPDCKIVADYAFGDCISLTEITIPSSVKYLGSDDKYGVFRDVRSITRVNLDDLDSWATVTLHNSVDSPFVSSNTALYINNVEITDLVFSNNVTKINEYTFGKFEKTTSVVLPNSVTEVGNEAFSIKSTISLILSDNLVSVAEGSFGYNELVCSNLTTDAVGNHYVPSNSNMYYMLTRNEQSASINSQCNIVFNCSLGGTSEYDIIIPASVLCMRGVTLYGTPKSLTVDPNNAVYHSNGNCIIETTTKKLILGYSGSIIPTDNSVESIGYNAFNTLPSTTIIPSNIITLESYSLNGTCDYFEIPDTVVNLTISNIWDSEFDLNVNANIVKLGSSFKKLPANVLGFGRKTSKVYLSKSVQEIDYNFQHMPNLTDIYYNGTKYEWAKISVDDESFDQSDFSHDFSFDNYTKYVTIHCTDGDI